MPLIKQANQSNQPSTGKQRYRCTACGYRFSRIAGIDFNNVCPYCSKKSVIKDAQQAAQKLIDDVDKWNIE